MDHTDPEIAKSLIQTFSAIISMLCAWITMRTAWLKYSQTDALNPPLKKTYA